MGLTQLRQLSRFAAGGHRQCDVGENFVLEGECRHSDVGRDFV